MFFKSVTLLVNYSFWKVQNQMFIISIKSFINILQSFSESISPSIMKMRSALPFWFWPFPWAFLSILGIHCWMQWILVHCMLFLSLLPLKPVLLQVILTDCNERGENWKQSCWAKRSIGWECALYSQQYWMTLGKSLLFSAQNLSHLWHKNNVDLTCKILLR